MTCGGLSPGLNNVIRALYMCLTYQYGVKTIHGLMFGFEGLVPESSQVIELNSVILRHVHEKGGTILGTSRGPQDPDVMVKFLVDQQYDILFTVGGDGTFRGTCFFHFHPNFQSLSQLHKLSRRELRL